MTDRVDEVGGVGDGFEPVGSSRGGGGGMMRGRRLLRSPRADWMGDAVAMEVGAGKLGPRSGHG